MKSREFFKNAWRSGLWPEIGPVHRSTLTKARKKIDWQIFRDILTEAVHIANSLWPKLPRYLWHGMCVYAIDGSKYTLPATNEIRKEFDPKSGLQYSGKGHFPQCLVSTVYDVFRRLPIARTIESINASERDQAKSLISVIPAGSVVLFDRGYPSYEFILFLCQMFSGYFIFRCPAASTFPAVESFIKSGKEEDTIWIDPSNKYLSRTSAKKREKLETIKLRVIRLVAPDGKVSVLLTNLYNKRLFSRSEIIDLYFRRWEIEVHYRDEKVVLEIEAFHGKTCNSIRQELFAAAIMTVISRTLMVISFEALGSEREFQFKNSIMTLASEAAVLSSRDPEKAVIIFEEIIKELVRVKYYRPKAARPAQPRVTKKNYNKWAVAKIKKVASA